MLDHNYYWKIGMCSQEVCNVCANVFAVPLRILLQLLVKVPHILTARAVCSVSCRHGHKLDCNRIDLVKSATSRAHLYYVFEHGSEYLQLTMSKRYPPITHVVPRRSHRVYVVAQPRVG